MGCLKKALWSLAASALLAAAAAAAGAEQRGGTPSSTTYVGRNQCGIVDLARLAPTAHAQGEVDGDGVIDHFIANWGGVERHATRPGSRPPTLVRTAVVYSSSATTQYSCVDLRLHDVDGDGDLDLIFASPNELVVLENRRGRFSVLRREPVELPLHAQVLVHLDGSTITVRDAATP